MNLKHRSLCTLILLVSLLSTAPTFSQDANRHVDINDVEVGDLVEANLHREWHSGTVTEVINKRLIRVKFDEKKRGIPESFMFRQEDVRFREDVSDPSAPEATVETPKPLEQRSWTSGAFSIKAAFLKMDTTHVWLRRDDGGTVKIERKLLSESDKEYLEKVNEQNPFGNSEENPFKVVKEPSSTTRPNRKPKVNISPRERKRATHVNGLELPLTEAIVDAASPLPAVNLKPWKMPAILREPLPSFKRSFAADAQSHHFKHVTFMPESENLIIGTRDLRRQVQGYIELGEDKTASSFIPAKRSDFSDVHSSGKYLVSYSSIRDYSRIDIWKLEDSKIRHHSSWEPPRVGQGFEQVNMAKFAGDFLVTLDGKWRLSIWDWRQAKLIYQQQSNLGCFSFHILPNKKQLVYGRQQRLHLLDIEKGEHLGSVAYPHTRCSIDISDDGKLAAVASKRVMIWDADGKLLNDFETTSKSRSIARAKWFDNRILLLQHSKEVDAIDTENRVTMARYKIDGNSILLDRGGRVWRIKTAPRTVSLDSLDLEPMQYESALPGSGNELLLFQPGTDIEISMNLPFNEDEKREIKSQLQIQLDRQGVQVVDSAPLKLTLELVDLESRVTNIQTFGIHRLPWSGEKIRIRPKQINIRLAEGKVRYYSLTKKVELPHLINGRRDETTQETIDRLMTVKPSYFSKLKLPLDLTKHPAEGAFALIDIDESGNKTESFPSLKAAD